MSDNFLGIPALDITDLMKRTGFQQLETYKEDLLIIDFERWKHQIFTNNSVPIRVEAFSLIMICSGECTIHINYIPYHLKPNMFIIIKGNQILSKISISENCTGYHLIAKKDFLHVALNNKKPPIKEILERENLEPVIIAPEKDFARLKEFVHQIIQCIYLKEHMYQRELIQNSLSNFIMEVWNISASVSPEDLGKDYALGLYEELTLHFLNLVNKKCKEIRDVSYYATQLCITPVYLTRIIKQLIGKTATQCISDILSDEAKLLLHQSGISIQQIAEELHFSDQAAFSKFFKKNTGMSPLDYRRRLGIR